MRRRLLIVVVSASVIGLVTAFFVYQIIMQRVAAYSQPSEDIVVAAVNMTVGETVTGRHVKLTSWPRQAVPQGALRSLDEAEGQVVRTSMVVGEPLLTSKLIDPESAARGGLLPMLVPEGLRGVTIKVDEAVKETGFVQPNSRVDVVASMRSEGGLDHVAKMILQNVQVLAAGQTVEMRDNKPVKVTTVTLALTPEQAERLALAQAETRGKLMLATRNIHDTQLISTPGSTKARLLGGDQPKESKAQEAANSKRPIPRGESHTVSVLKAGKPSELTFVRESSDRWVAAGSR